MGSRFFSRRSFALAGLLSALLFPATKPAHADLYGADIPILTGILTEAVTTVSNLVSMLAVLKEQLAATNEMLSKLDPASFEAMTGLVRSNEMSFDQLTQGVSSIGYTLGGVNSQFKSVYKRDFSTTPFSAFDSNYARWHDEVLASSEIAARSQSALATLDKNTEAASAILRSSSKSEGVVGQLQAVNQMLGVIQSQNNTLIQTLSTTGRVLAAAAGSQASEAHLAREKKKRNLSNYRERGDVVPPMTKLP